MTTPAAGSYTTLGPTRKDVSSRVRSVLPWVVVLVLGIVAIIAVGDRSTGPDRLLDPRSAGKQGTKALAEVLRQNAIDVQVVTVPEELPPSGSPGTTVVATGDAHLTPAMITEVQARSRGADRLIVLLAEPGVVPLIEPHLSGYAMPATHMLPSAPASGCQVDGIRPGDVVAGASVMMLAAGPVPDASFCLPVQGHPDGGTLLTRLPGTGERPETVLVGFGTGLTNAGITGEDTAAVALRLLGQSPQVTWLVPRPSSDAATGSGAYSPWPLWLTPVALVLAGGTVLLALVRGRRLGRIVPEPLPVIVRAAETTESRGHLYRRSRDTARTALILREATRTRLRRRLGIARSAPLADLIVAVAAATGEPQDRIQSLLVDSDPGSGPALTALGTDLVDLEGKVRRI